MSLVLRFTFHVLLHSSFILWPDHSLGGDTRTVGRNNGTIGNTLSEMFRDTHIIGPRGRSMRATSDGVPVQKVDTPAPPDHVPMLLDELSAPPDQLFIAPDELSVSFDGVFARTERLRVYKWEVVSGKWKDSPPTRQLFYPKEIQGRSNLQSYAPCFLVVRSR